MKHTMTLLVGWLVSSLLAQEPQPTLRLQEALTRGLARSDWQGTLEARVSLAESKVIREQTWDNPQLSVSSERSEVAGIRTTEDFLVVSQRLEPFGSRRLRTEAAQHRREVARLEVEWQRAEMIRLIKESFFEVLYAQERLSALEQWNQSMGELEERVTLAEEAGHVSGYDRRRLMREVAEARATLFRERAAYAASWEQLGTLLDLEEPAELSGELLPAAPTADVALEEHPKLLALEAQIEAASAEATAAGRWKLTELSLEAGLKRTRVAGAEDYGLLFSAKIPLPLFNRKDAERLQARARGMAARGEKSLVQAKAQGRIRALRQQIKELRDVVTQFHLDAIEPSRALVTIAELAYLEGEIEKLALLDAYQSLRDAELKVLGYAAEARGLMIELETWGGVK